MTPSYCSVQELWHAMQSGESPQLIDVREAAEYAAEHIENSLLVPLSRLDQEASRIERSRPAYVFCRTENRSREAAKRLRDAGFSRITVVEGGLTAWKENGYAVVRGRSGAWPLERQVRFGAGALVLSGVGLGACVHGGFYGLAGFVGAGLLFSGVTDTCGMAMVLTRMPWNRRSYSHGSKAPDPAEKQGT